MNDGLSVVFRRLLVLLSVLGGVLTSSHSVADAAAHQNAQVFICDAKQGSSYLLNIVATEQGSLEALVFRQADNSETQAASNVIDNLEQGLRLAWTPVTTGFSFHGQGFELVGLANAAVLHDGAQALVCHLQPAPKPIVNPGFPTYGKSLGGRIRSGPGMDFITRKLIAPDTPITLIENTDLSMDGYDWFRVETNEVSGYQWGGVICSIDGKLSGALHQCE